MGKYDDLLQLPHPTSEKHPRMSLHDRAAQFSPFRALTGYEDTIQETARLTEQRVELDETEKAALDEKLRLLAECFPDQPTVSITYFQPDPRKSGGSYLTVTGKVKRIYEMERVILMTNGPKIPMDEIRDIHGSIFSQEEP